MTLAITGQRLRFGGQKKRSGKCAPFFDHEAAAVGQPTQRRALRNMRIHGESSPLPAGYHDIWVVRWVRSGCGIMMVKRPLLVVTPVMPSGEPLGLKG